MVVSPLASFPETRTARSVALRLGLVRHPDQFQHEVFEKESPVCCALARMRVARSFGETQAQKRLSLGSAGCAANKGVIHLEPRRCITQAAVLPIGRSDSPTVMVTRGPVEYSDCP